MKKQILYVMLLFSFMLAGCGAPSEMNAQQQGTLCVSFINIGKGDAFLIDVFDDGFYMCDTGKEQDFNKIARVLKMKNVNHINGIFLSHGHKDHTGNIEHILKHFEVDKIYISDKNDPSYRNCPIYDIAEKYQVEVIPLHSGDHLQFHDLGIDVWTPSWVDKKNENNNSLVMHMRYGNTAFLMTGDMELEEEATFLYENREIKSDVLKLGHHGEKDATSAALLERVSCKYAIITGNAKENPQSVNKTIKDRLAAFGVEPFYSEGDQVCIDFISNKENVGIRYVYDKTKSSPIRIRSLDIKNQVITLENTGDKSYDISNYGIRSKHGEEWFFIPPNTILNAHDTLRIATLDSDSKMSYELLWKEHNIWDRDKLEAAVLYDQNFKKVDKMMGGYGNE